MLKSIDLKKKRTLDEKKLGSELGMANSLEIIYEGVEQFIQVDKKSKTVNMKGSVHKVMIRDNESYATDQFKQTRDKRLDIFKRFFSSPLNDQDYLGQQNTANDLNIQKQAYFALQVTKNVVKDETTGEDIVQESIEGTCLMN